MLSNVNIIFQKIVEQLNILKLINVHAIYIVYTIQLISTKNGFFNESFICERVFLLI